MPFRVTLWKSPLSPSAAPMVDAHALTQNGIEPDLFPLETGERARLKVTRYCRCLLPFSLQTDISFFVAPLHSAGKGLLESNRRR